MKDAELLRIYMMGWHDCGDSKDQAHLFRGIKKIAYQNGWSDFLLGDDLSHVDLQTNQEILSKIRNVQLKKENTSFI